MKFKSILLLLSTVVLFSFTSTPVVKKIVNDDALTLSKDKDFCEMFNSIINFTYSFNKEKKIELLQEYATGKTSEKVLLEVLKVSGIKSEEELHSAFSEISNKNKLLTTRYEFLKNYETSKEIVKEALIIAAKNGSFSKVFKLPEDCLIALMANLAVCYAIYDFCWGNNGIDCVAAWSACIALSWNSYDSCFY
jgi:hypothetical protein